MKAFLILLGLVPFLSLAETFSLNADWRFAKAAKPIPLAQAKASVETAGVTDVVAALYERKPGEVWPVAEIKARAKKVKDHGSHQSCESRRKPLI